MGRAAAAVAQTQAAREERREGVSPTAKFVVGVLRNFVLGVPSLAGATVLGYRALTALELSLATRQKVDPDATLRWADFLTLVPAALLGLLALCFLAPGQMEAFARFIGLGNIIDRLPFLRSRSPAAMPPPLEPAP